MLTRKPETRPLQPPRREPPALLGQQGTCRLTGLTDAPSPARSRRDSSPATLSRFLGRTGVALLIWGFRDALLQNLSDFLAHFLIEGQNPAPQDPHRVGLEPVSL